LVLAGCSGGAISGLDETVVAGAQVTGVVHGGQQPIVGAEIFLFAANTTGYGGNGLAASASNASISLLQGAENTVQDTTSTDPTYLDYYTTTDSNGNFAITGDYTCTPGSQVYIYALGGNSTYPTGSANSAIGLLAAVGPCPGADSFPSSTYIVVNEVSTIATAYAFAGFATDALHVSNSGTTLAQTGIANAFANVANLETLSAGTALATIPAGSGTAPQTTINTLANILAACVNTSTASSTGCSTLFTDSMSAGTSGTAATDTATAAINIAHNPGSNIAALYAIPTANPPFAPALTAQPSDFSLYIKFTGGGFGIAQSVAVDSSGNAWVASQDSGVVELSSSGVILSGANGYTDGNQHGTLYLAIDLSGNAWVTNGLGDSVTKFSSSGAVLSGTQGYTNTSGGVYSPAAIGIDAYGNAWFGDSSPYNVAVELSNSGAVLSGANGYAASGGLFQGSTSGIGFDGSGNVWMANDGSPFVSKLSSSGTLLSGVSGYTGGGLGSANGIAIDSEGDVWVASTGAIVSQPGGLTKFSNAGVVLLAANAFGRPFDPQAKGVAIDGAGNAWVTSSGALRVFEISNSGTLLSPAVGYGNPPLEFLEGIAVDGSGDVWFAAQSQGGFVAELIGIATPVITPICAGLPASPTANGTSNLGTRP
jgi:sugar lactone lactonase YvrE